MSKKKRNRRPPSPTPAMSAARAPATEALLDDEACADEAAAEAGATPVVDAALAQAVAIAAADDAPDDPPDTAAVRVAGPTATQVAATPASANAPSWAASPSGDIRGVLIQVAGGRLLLPNATIAEVLSYAEPEPSDAAADWLLGRFRWRGWQLPLVAFARLAGIGEDRPGLGSKVVVLKALGGDPRTPYFALLTQGFPRLVTVSRAALGVEDDDATPPPGVQAFVRLNDEPALLPDLLQIEARLHEVREAA